MSRTHGGGARLVGRMLIGLIAAVVLFAPSLANAQSSGARWTCRASMSYILLPDGTRIEPVLANGSTNPSEAGFPNRDHCTDDETSVPSQSSPDNPLGTVGAQVIFAKTEVIPTGSTTPSAVDGGTYVQSSDANVGGGAIALHTAVTRSVAAGACAGADGRTPQFVGTSQVLGTTINGNDIPADATASMLATALNGSPLAALITLNMNEQVRTGTPGSADEGLVVRALRLDLGGASGIRIVLGETQAGRAGGNPCTAVPPGSCPPGSVRDPNTGFCVVQVTLPGPPGPCPPGTTQNSDGTCVLVVPVGSGTPIGGTIVPTGQIPGFKNSLCRAKRFGNPKTAIVGTNGVDKITGTDKPDRIFSLSGNDRVDGGRGADCIDGGPGKDRLDGGAGSDILLGQHGRDFLSGGSKNDRLIGSLGNDVLAGGSGNDRLEGGKDRDKLDGGPGNDLIKGGKNRDYIVGGHGRDRIFGDGGSDFVNMGVDGPPAIKIDCGAGKDVVRANTNERRHVHHCERMIIFK